MTCAELTATFEGLGIPTGAPGFYEHPNFVAQAQQDPTFFERYADFVLCQDHRSADIQNIVARLVAAIGPIAAQSGARGSYIDAACATSWVLNQKGIWNFIVKGSLRASQDPEVDRFCHYDVSPSLAGRSDAGHAWVVAPPFFIVDPALQAQRYVEVNFYPRPSVGLAAAGELSGSKPLSEYCSRELLSFARFQPDLTSFIEQARVETEATWEHVPPRQTIRNSVFLDYIPSKVAGPPDGWTPDSIGTLGRSARDFLLVVS